MRFFLNSRKILILIVLLAIVLTFYKLGQNPLSLNWDETSNAYNAYSILKTGRDEYGNLLPLANRSFDDYKPPLYMYLDIIPVAIFGLTEQSARIPSAVSGVLSVIFIYFLVKKLFISEKISLLSAFFLAVSPWYLQFSRIGLEANVGFFMMIASFTLFIYGVGHGLKTKSLSSLDFQSENQGPGSQAIQNWNKILLVASAIFFGISLYSYHAQRIISPLLLICSIILFRQYFFLFPKKIIIVFFLIIALFVIPLFLLLPKEAFINRFESTSQQAQLKDVDNSVELIKQDSSLGRFGNIIHNRRVLIAQSYFKNYLSNFGPNFLFMSDDNYFRHHIENMGLLYLFQLPLLFVGTYLLVKHRSKNTKFIIFWLTLSPVPAVTGDVVPHAIRSYTLLVPFTIICSFALIYIFKEINYKNLFLLISFIIFTYSFLAYINNYWAHYPQHYASSWQYGYKQAAQESAKLSANYEKIKVDRSIEQAYIFWLFNTKYDPQQYQKQGSRAGFGKYHFDQDAPTNNTELYIGTNLPSDFETVKIIYYPDTKEAIKIGHPK